MMEQHIYSADTYRVAVVVHHPWAVVYLLDLLLLLYTALTVYIVGIFKASELTDSWQSLSGTKTIV